MVTLSSVVWIIKLLHMLGKKKKRYAWVIIKCIDLGFCYNIVLYHTLTSIACIMNWIELNRFKFNWKEKKCKWVEKIEIFLWIWCRKKNLKKHKSKKTFFHASLLGNGLNKFQTRIWLDKTPWHSIIILLKLVLMNNCH
jgi:hypothetical protein